MKNFLPIRSSFFKIILIGFFAFSWCGSKLSAQDPAVLGINAPGPQVFADQGTPIAFTVGNLGLMPAFDLLVVVQVFDPLNVPVFFWQTMIPVLNPLQTMNLNSLPAQWVPSPPGPYQVHIMLFAEVDTDPTNNTISQPVQAMPQPPTTLHQIDMLNPYQTPNSTYGVFCITYPSIPAPLFVNAMANDPNGSGMGWVVRNLPLLPFDEPQTLCYWFDLRLLGFAEGNNVPELNISVRLDPQTLPGPFPVQQWQLKSLTPKPYNVKSGNDAELVQTTPITVTFPLFGIYTPLTWLYRGCTVPNIDLDSSAHKPSPTYAGDWNACGPAAAANSMQWLENTHPNIPANGLSLRQKMESLSGHMDRADTSGVTTTQLVRGKLAYIDEHRLPIHVKYQSQFVTDSSIASPNPNFRHKAENKGGVGTPAYPTWEFLKAEMDRGEDVEILFGWYDSLGVRKGGHWITATGYAENAAFKGIFFKDDANQSNNTGTGQDFVFWHTDSTRSRLVGFDGPNNYCWVESIVSESYDPKVTFKVVDMKMERVHWVDPFVETDSLLGMFSFGVPPSQEVRFLNVLANLPDSTPFWLIRNLILPPDSTIQDVSAWFNFGHLAGGPVLSFDSVECKLGITNDFYIDSFFDIAIDITLPVTPFTKRIGSGRADFDPLGIPFFLPEYPIFNPLFIPPIHYVYRGCKVPNIDLDSINHNPVTSPGYAGDTNACGPAGAANSLQWLEETHPKINPNGQTLRQKMQELSGLMNRDNNSTVTDEDFIKGKLAFIDKYKLPIRVKFQSSLEGMDNVASPDTTYGHFAQNKNDSAMAKLNWDWLVSEMEHGEDVELGVGFYDKDNVPKGGHWVTLSGVSQVGGVRAIHIKDDLRQDTTGGMRQQWVYWLIDSTGAPYLAGMSGTKYTVRPEIVVSESYDSTVTHEVFNLKIDKLVWEDPLILPDPHVVFFDFSFPPKLDTSYMNILVALPDSTPQWLARNVLLPPRELPEHLTLWWNLADLGLLPHQTADNLQLKIGINPEFHVDSFFDVFYEISLPIGTRQYEVGNGAPHIDIELLPLTLPPLPPFEITIPNNFVYRGCEVPNIDLDSIANNPVTMPGYAGDKNACGPAAAANSLQWLENTHPLIPSTGTTHREKLKELSAMMKRVNNGGVYRRDFIEAKLEFIDKYKLPIHVKFQGFRFNADDIPSPDTLYGHVAENKNDSAFAKVQWDWLMQEMQNGEDVELEFGYYDSLGVRKGGHWVTITGVHEEKGIRTIYFKDDTRQRTSGGMRQQCAQWAGHPTGHTWLPDLSGSKYTCWVETVVSESYDPTITFCPDDLTLGQDPIPSGIYEASNAIYLTGRIESGSNVTVSAPNIFILPGFVLELGATLTAITQGCQD